MDTEKRTAVSGCIVTYNNADEIENCIRSLLEQTKGVDFKLYVSDNDSKDNTVEIVRSRFPEVTVLENKKNGGFGAGHNAVLPFLESEYHAIINPDITLKEDAISLMTAYMAAHPEVGLMHPDILNADGTRQELPKRYPTLWYLFGGNVFKSVRAEYCRTKEHISVPTEVDFCTGCFMFIRTELFRKLGGFDPRYFLYMEDADLGREVQQTHKVLFYPYAHAYHGWQRSSHRNWKLFKIHLHSVRLYLQKWKGRK